MSASLFIQDSTISLLSKLPLEWQTLKGCISINLKAVLINVELLIKGKTATMQRLMPDGQPVLHC